MRLGDQCIDDIHYLGNLLDLEPPIDPWQLNCLATKQCDQDANMKTTMY